MNSQTIIVSVAIGLLVIMAIVFTILYILKRQERMTLLSTETIGCPTYMCEDENPLNTQQAWRQGATTSPSDIIIQGNTSAAKSFAG